MSLPQGFVYLEDPRIQLGMNYATPHNFVGCKIDGYHSPVCILTEDAAKALVQIQDYLDRERPGVCLKIFDAYRPQQAVEHFKRWSTDPSDQCMREHFYPTFTKPELFEQGYISKRSDHSRGSTIDLTLVERRGDTFIEFDMGTPFDFFDPRSHTENALISFEAQNHRRFFIEIMHNAGFQNYPCEWWHFTLKDEPFPDTYFDFPVK